MFEPIHFITKCPRTLIPSASNPKNQQNQNHQNTMKKHLLALLVAAGAFSGTVAQAYVAPGSGAPGDVILGFQDTAQNIDYIVDLGAGSSFSGFTSINIGTDLAAAFGAGWATNSNLYFGVFGINSAKSQIWASTLSGNSAFPVKVAGALSITYQHYTTMLNAFNTGGTVLTTGVQLNGASGLSFQSWTGNSPTAAPTSAFAVYNQSLEAGVAANQTLDVYQTGNTGGSSTALFKEANGNPIQVTSAGVVQVVPEPSTYALMGLGALVLVVLYRRKARA
jgi:hypothetical protein